MSGYGKEEILLVFDRPNMGIEFLGKRIDHYKFFKYFAEYFAEEKKYLVVLFFWRSDYNESSQPYARHLSELQDDLFEDNISFQIFTVMEKDVDVRIINVLMTKIIRHDYRPNKLILCSGDKDFVPILGLAAHHGIETIVVSGNSCCAEKLKTTATKIIYIEDIIGEVSMDSPNSNQ